MFLFMTNNHCSSGPGQRMRGESSIFDPNNSLGATCGPHCHVSRMEADEGGSWVNNYQYELTKYIQLIII